MNTWDRRATPGAQPPRARLLLAAMLAGALVWPAVPAAAQTTDPPVTGLVVVQGEQLSAQLQMSDLAPGQVRDAVIFLDGPRPEEIDRLGLRFHDLVDLDASCLETDGGVDGGCDPAVEGQLSEWLEVTLHSGVEVGAGAERACRIAEAATYEGTLRELAAPDLRLLVERGEGAAPDPWCVVTSYAFTDRGESDNATQGDVTVVTLTASLASDEATDDGTDDDGTDDDGTDDDGTDDDGTDVEGVVIEPPGDGDPDTGGPQRDVVPTEVRGSGDSRPTQPAPSSLARTGLATTTLLLLALGLLTTGAAALRRSAARRSPGALR